MKKYLLLILICILFVGCGKKDYVTREEIDEIVEQSVQESLEEEKISDDEKNEEMIEPEYKIPVGLANLEYQEFMSSELIDTIGNYETIDITPDEDCFIFRVNCKNKTDKTIKYLSVIFSQSETEREMGAVTDIAPGEAMTFEFIMTSSDDIIHASVDKIEYAEE